MRYQLNDGREPTGSYGLHSECGGRYGDGCHATGERSSSAGPESDSSKGKETGSDAARNVVDAVNHPPHYNQGGVECIEAIQAALTPEEFRGYCKGNAIKYIWRERMKGQAESLEKAAWYLGRLT